MRSFLMCSAIFLFLINVSPSRAEVAISVGLNFSELDVYGEWVHIHGLGRVWRPDADVSWRPFMYGRWVYSTDGWLWDSDEPFGWIVCHYGNWYDDDEFGWVWVPGYEWSPARVEWYVTDNEIAWAPMFPPGYHHRFSRVRWMFCPVSLFSSVEIHSHVHLRLRPAPRTIKVKVYAGAPRFEFVRRHVRTPVVRVTPRRVKVSNREHPLIRIEIDRHHHSKVVVPIGRKYRKVEVRKEHERPHVIVQPREEHERARVIVEPREHEKRERVVVQPKSERQERKARVEVKKKREDRGDNDKDDEDDNKQKRKRIRVDVR